MPHLIIEYSPALAPAIRSALLPLHQTLLASDQFGENDIKVRARGYEDYLVGGQAAGDFAHLTLYLLDGRSAEVKADLSRALMAAVQDALAGVAPLQITVDIRDMVRAHYGKHVLTG